MSSQQISLSTLISADYSGMRLDQVLAKCFPEYSRSRITQWIRAGDVTLNGLSCEPKFKVTGGEQVLIEATMMPIHVDLAQPIPLNVVYEDEDLLVINKPAGLVVHPAAGNRHSTLLNALLHHAPQVNLLPRAGIVHRLDKDTTGLMVVAKTITAHTVLVAALQRREFQREYLALVSGELISGATVEAPIGRHPYQRTKMAVTDSGKPAVTHYRCKKRYHGFTLLQVKLETGRTHQIRVHLSYRNYPIVGDALYGWRCRLPAKSCENLQSDLLNFKRQALHAHGLGFVHPTSGEAMYWETPLPADFAYLLTQLQPKEGYYD
jgi:23S rRNA pseudouridine1911/1915/1917 synthase